MDRNERLHLQAENKQEERFPSEKKKQLLHWYPQHDGRQKIGD